MGNNYKIQLLRRLLFKLLLVTAVTLPSLLMQACTHEELAGDDPESIYNAAEENYKDENYFQALEKYRDLKNRFPYHSRATDAELRIADSYFAQEQYLEAASSYEIFKELHPTHPKADYVQFQIALSYFNQIPENSARDLSAAYRAIEQFEIVKEKFPDSENAKKATEYIAKARAKLAEHENYVADFYYRRHHFLSATYRYSSLLRDFPKSEFEEEALIRLGRSYANIRMYGNARDSLNRLMSQYPDSPYKSEAQALLEELKEKKN